MEEEVESINHCYVEESMEALKNHHDVNDDNVNSYPPCDFIFESNSSDNNKMDQHQHQHHSTHELLVPRLLLKEEKHYRKKSTDTEEMIFGKIEIENEHNNTANEKKHPQPLLLPLSISKSKSKSKSNGSSFSRSDYMKKLYNEICHLWPTNLNQYLRPLQHAEVADMYYRNALSEIEGRPTLVVLSESAAPTDERVFGLDLKQQEFQNSYCSEGVNYRHFGHLNLVHCLSYGDGFLLQDDTDERKDNNKVIVHNTCSDHNHGGDKDSSQPIPDTANKKLHTLNRGTPVFWDLLSCLAGEQDDLEADEMNFDHLKLKGGLTKMDRVKNKLAIFEKLRRQGIVLLDISVVPIYLGAKRIIKTNKIKGTSYSTPEHSMKEKEKEAILRLMWEKYSVPLLNRNPPHAFIVIGRSLESAVSKQRFEEFADTHKDCHYLGCKVHPSLRRLSTADRRKLYYELGQQAKTAVEKDSFKSNMRVSYKINRGNKKGRSKLEDRKRMLSSEATPPH